MVCKKQDRFHKIYVKKKIVPQNMHNILTPPTNTSFMTSHTKKKGG